MRSGSRPDGTVVPFWRQPWRVHAHGRLSGIARSEKWFPWDPVLFPGLMTEVRLWDPVSCVQTNNTDQSQKEIMQTYNRGGGNHLPYGFTRYRTDNIVLQSLSKAVLSSPTKNG